MNKLIISSEAIRQRAIHVLSQLPLEPVQEVVIREHKKNRSLDANSLYWRWLTVIGAELGESKEKLHEDYKAKYLCNIYERDNPEYAEMIQAVRDVYAVGMKDKALLLHKKIISLTSTTTATVAQMSEYLHCIEMSAAKMDIRLPFPE